jgi:aerobic carbon-monoxide dehydrogenase small subunit
MTSITLTVNGRRVTADIEPRMHLADFVRETQTLTGTHLGCEHGVCGACTVLLDGVPVRSCITFAVACSGASVTTIEGLDEDEIGTELRAAFSREHALQCGYCSPGMLVSARDVVLRAPEADEHAIRIAMSGNLCRCTGYVGIVRAVKRVIEDRRARGVAPVRGAGRTVLGPAGSGHGNTINVSEVASASRNEPPAKTSAAAVDRMAISEPQASFDQSFTIRRSLAEVWSFFEDTAKVAACLPGVSITGDATAREVTGKMRVKVGPISADFHGIAEIDRDPGTHSGTIHGSGRDQRSASATHGIIRYRLLPTEDDATKVELNVGYRLTGPLAQFSRSDLVRDIARRLISVFAQNVEAQLAGARSLASVAEFNASCMLVAVVTGQIRLLLRRIFGGKNLPH